MIRIFPSSI